MLRKLRFSINNFQTIFTVDNGFMPNSPTRTTDESDGISDVRINPQNITTILKKLKTNSAAGPDFLPPIFFHYTCYTISFPLSIIFRALIDTHSVPHEWKHSIVTPKYKKGSTSDPSNYRPISLTCTCCKILESLIYNDIMQYLIEHNPITKHQPRLYEAPFYNN